MNQRNKSIKFSVFLDIRVTKILGMSIFEKNPINTSVKLLLCLILSVSQFCSVSFPVSLLLMSCLIFLGMLSAPCNYKYC